MTYHTQVAVIGAGPAGLSAALEIASAGGKVTVFDENDRPGGQLFKQIHKFFGSSHHGAGVRGYHLGEELLQKCLDAGVEIKLNTVVYGLFPDNELGIVCNDQTHTVKADKILIATGASEKPLAFPGWDLPGVMGAGAAQTMVNINRVLPGQKFVMIGSGNVGLVVSYQIMQAGGQVVAIEEAGADGVLLVSPYYNKPNQEGLYQHFKSIAESTALPVLLYNVPGRTGVSIQPATVARLAQVPNIVGMKDAAGNMDNLTQLLRTVPEQFHVYTGDDNLLIPAMAIGVYGLISVCAQVIPVQLRDMMKAFDEHRTEDAAAMHRKWFPVLDVMFIASNPVPTKVALNLMGYNVGKVRLPLTMPSKGQAEEIARVLKAAGVIESDAVPEGLYV